VVQRSTNGSYTPAVDAWDAKQYNRFAAERRQPFVDLCALIQIPPDACERKCRAIDLGCGDGALTLELYERLGREWQAVELSGLDNSPRMFEAAQQQPQAGTVRFQLGDVGRFVEKALLGETAPYDLVFSNAALHWVPAHERLFAGLAEAVAPGGQLAVQMPANHAHPSQVIARKLASTEPFATALGELASSTSPHSVLALEDYAGLLHRCGFAEQHVRLQVYSHELTDSTEVVEWLRGSLLTAYQQRLDSELWERFLADYRGQLAVELGTGRAYLLTYNRILLWARRA
jgi:trans-aconitate 2-methyltransferase